jgi:tetratricopeptide (TPR) repeat protein
MNELDDALHERIKSLCADGDAAAARSDFGTAIDHYEAAWELLPEPKTSWDAARWILAAVGDAHYLSGEFEQGRDVLLTAMHCPDAIGNPFLHLRLGQCQFELGFDVIAADELSRAFLLAGDELFLDEDPKYLAHVKSVLDEPPGGWD